MKLAPKKSLPHRVWNWLLEISFIELVTLVATLVMAAGILGMVWAMLRGLL